MNRPDPIFVDGMYIKEPQQGAPDFILHRVSMKMAQVQPFLDRYQKDGWVNLEIKRSKTGKLYFELDQFEPSPKDVHDQGMAQARAAAEPAQQTQDFGNFDDDIPFSNYEYRGWA